MFAKNLFFIFFIILAIIKGAFAQFQINRDTLETNIRQEGKLLNSESLLLKEDSRISFLFDNHAGPAFEGVQVSRNHSPKSAQFLLNDYALDSSNDDTYERAGHQSLIPPIASNEGTLQSAAHPLSDKINRFLYATNQPQDFKHTGLNKESYLKIIDGQVRAMKRYQNSDGRIIDPVENVEKFYSTPCYAHSVAALVVSSYIQSDDELAISGMKALDVSLTDMVNATVNGNHGDFYTWPVMFAYELFKPYVSKERLKAWNVNIQSIKIEKLYNAYNKQEGNNWVLVHTAGEFLRATNGFTSFDYVEKMLGLQLPDFTELGMYNEDGNPLPYDLFSRHYMCGMLQRNYNGKYHNTLRDALWKGAWMSLFMQSPFGELPTGYRSSHHIWNEAEQCVIFEIYAAEYARLGFTKEAGVFKRAARLSLSSINQWIREDGSGFIVKNRYPIENRHGYEHYSVHTCYNMLACSMLAQAWQFADNLIIEKPAPADVGGFVVPILKPFHKVFANCKGTYLEYDTKGDQKYNPTGIIRIHIKGGHPQLGPSDGAAAYFSGQGVSLATGPSWRCPDGTWSSLAMQNDLSPEIEVIKEKPELVKIHITYDLNKSQSAPENIIIRETITVQDRKITVKDNVKGEIDKIRISWPMLVFNGETNTEVDIKANVANLMLNNKGIRFTINHPVKTTINRTGVHLKHRNGLIEEAYAEISGNQASYTFEDF